MWGYRNIFLILAVICFLIAFLLGSGLISLGTRIDWQDLGLFFGFLSLGEWGGFYRGRRWRRY